MLLFVPPVIPIQLPCEIMSLTSLETRKHALEESCSGAQASGGAGLEDSEGHFQS